MTNVVDIAARRQAATPAQAQDVRQFDADRIAEVAGMLNQICITGCGTQGRLVGIHRDAFDSYYHLLVLDENLPEGHSDNSCYDTMVGGCESMIGLRAHAQLDDHYTRMGLGPVSEMLVTSETRAKDIACYGHSAVDNGYGFDDRIILNPETALIDTPRRHQWILIRRAGWDDRTIIGIEEHDELRGVVLDPPSDGDWNALLLRRIEAGLLRWNQLDPCMPC